MERLYLHIFFPSYFPPDTLTPPGALPCDTPVEKAASFSLDPFVKMSVFLGWSLTLYRNKLLTRSLRRGRDAGSRQQKLRRWPQTHPRDHLLVHQHWLGYSSLCPLLYLMWLLPALLTYPKDGQNRVPSRVPPSLNEPVCTHLRKIITRSHLGQGCRLGFPGGGQPSRAPTLRDHHPLRASPVCQGWSAHNFLWETPLASLVVDWKNKTRSNAWSVLGKPALGVYMS